MKLRVVSGSLKGRFLTIPERDCGFRPTRERVRESVADILVPRIGGSSVADVCAGSGAFGFEMLSRGARRCMFVENDRYRVKLILDHAQRFGVAPECTVRQCDVRAFPRGCGERFDIIYFDPPYDDPTFDSVIPALSALLSDRGILVCERRNCRKGGVPEDTLSHLPPFDRRSYGETEVWFFRSREPEAAS